MTIRNRFIKDLSSFFGISTSFRIIAVSAFVISFNACYNEPNLLGGDLLPSDDKSLVQITDTFSVAAYTIRTDTLITSNIFQVDGSAIYSGSKYAVLGNFNDQFFGGIKSNFYTRFCQSNSKDTLRKVIIANRPVADSLILKLKLNKTWGENNKTIIVKVFSLTSRLDSSKLFNGLVNPGITYHPTQVNEPTVYRGEEYLKIKFTKAFRDSIMKTDTSLLSDPDKFMQRFYGLYFTADSLTDNKGGVMYSFDLNASVFSMYYPKSNPKYRQPSYNLFFGLRLFNYFQRDYTKAEPALKIPMKYFSEISDNTPQDTVFAVEGFGGVRGLVKLKGIKNWKKLMPIAIHRAELRFDILDLNQVQKDSSMKRLYFYNYRYFSMDNNKILNITDVPMYDKASEADYYKAKKYYSIDVTIHLQSMLYDKISKDYIIIENKNNSRTYMQGLYRTANNSKPMKLIITYSKL